MTAPELKPCPFCGGEAYLSNKMLDERYGYAEQSEVWCKTCRIGYVFQDSQNPKGGYALEGTGEQKSIAAWNHRADLAAVQPAQVLVKPLGSDGVKIHPQDILNAAWRDDLGHEGRAMYDRILAAFEPQLTSGILHRSFPDAGDGRPMPPMGDQLMIAGLSVDDARFVAVQLAQHGLTLTAHPDPRDEVIKGLVEALEEIASITVHSGGDVHGVTYRKWQGAFQQAQHEALAALAAAKAVQHG